MNSADIKRIARFFLVSPLGRALYWLILRRNEFDDQALKRYISWRRNTIERAFGQRISLAPLMDKAAYKKSPKSYQRQGVKIAPSIHTSGTTGTPASFLQSVGAVLLEEAHVQRQLVWAGAGLFSKRVWVRGDVVASGTHQEQRWSEHWGCRTLVMSSYHLSADVAEDYLQRISSYAPFFIQAYPSSIVFLARAAQASRLNLNFDDVKAIITSSESLSAVDRKLVERVFGCPVFDWYGQSERVAAIGTCPVGKKHLIEDYGLYEFEASETGSTCLVATGLNNTATRLWRYRTGDNVRLSDGACSCGRLFRIVDQIEGRDDQSVVLGDGRVVNRLDHVLKGVGGVVEAQIVQVSSNAFEVRVVAADAFDVTQEQQIVSNFKERVGGVSVVVLRVSSIPRGARGKFEFVKVEWAGACNEDLASGVTHECPSSTVPGVH